MLVSICFSHRQLPFPQRTVTNDLSGGAMWCFPASEPLRPGSRSEMLSLQPGYTRSTDTRSYSRVNSFLCKPTTGRKYWLRAAESHPAIGSSGTVTTVSCEVLVCRLISGFPDTELTSYVSSIFGCWKDSIMRRFAALADGDIPGFLLGGSMDHSTFGVISPTPISKNHVRILLQLRWSASKRCTVPFGTRFERYVFFSSGQPAPGLALDWLH
jgi:hypothetical protein